METQKNIYEVLELRAKNACGGLDRLEAYHVGGEKVLFKPTKTGLCALSEVFHSNLAMKLGLPTVKNRLAHRHTDDKSVGGIATKKATRGNQRLVDLNLYSIYRTDNEAVCHARDTMFDAWNYFRNRLSRHSYFQNIKLETIMEEIFSEQSPKFKEDFIKTWFTSHIFANLDQVRGDNVFLVVSPDNELIDGAISLDFELCEVFAKHTEYTNRHCDNACHEIVMKGMNPENISFIKKHFKSTAEEVFDNMQTMKSSPELVKLCDFKGVDFASFGAGVRLSDVKYRKRDPKLSRLSEEALAFYQKRFDFLTKQYVK